MWPPALCGQFYLAQGVALKCRDHCMHTYLVAASCIIYESNCVLGTFLQLLYKSISIVYLCFNLAHI